MQGKIRVVFFDMGDTLTTILPSWASLYVMVCQRHDIPIDEADVTVASSAVFGALDTNEARMTYEASEEADERYYREINGEILRRAGVPEDRIPMIVDEVHAEFDRPVHYHLYPDAIATLRALRDAGYRLGIISNWSWNLPDICDGLAITDYLAHIVTSARVGASKPHRAIFDYALHWFGVRPEEAVHIGDNAVADVAGARAAGIHAILMDRRASATSAGAPFARSLAEIPALVAGIA